MKCPKCGYITFDFYDACPKCNRDLTEVRNRLILFPFRASPINWLEAREEEPLSPASGIAEGDIAAEKGTAGEEIELEAVSLDSLDVAAEKEEEKESKKEIEKEQQEEKLEEEEGIEIEPVDLKFLEEQMEKKEKEKREEVKKETEEKEVELEPIDLASLEIELEEEKDQEK